MNATDVINLVVITVVDISPMTPGEQRLVL